MKVAFEEEEEGGPFGAFPTKESEDTARRVACRKELIDSVPASPEAVFSVIQSALIRSDVEDHLLLIWQDQLKSRLPEGWELEWDLERYKSWRGFWIRFPGDGRAFRLQFRFDWIPPDMASPGKDICRRGRLTPLCGRLIICPASSVAETSTGCGIEGFPTSVGIGEITKTLGCNVEWPPSRLDYRNCSLHSRCHRPGCFFRGPRPTRVHGQFEERVTLGTASG